VHEEQARLVVEHVVVDRRDLDAVRLQGLDDRVHLVDREHEVTGGCRLAGSGRNRLGVCQYTATDDCICDIIVRAPS
jgi:hypothetical protein